MLLKNIFFGIIIFFKSNLATGSINLINIKEKDMGDTLKVLKDMETTLWTFCKPIAEKLKKGLTNEFVDNVFNRQKISNNELKGLYIWKNGIEVDSTQYVGMFDFCSLGKMMPLEDAAARYETYVAEGLWDKKFFPVITTNAGDYLLYDMDNSSKTYGMLLLYSPSLFIVEPETAYDSLESFFETIVACYKQGVYKFNESDKRLEIDQDREFEISAKMNPVSEYWIK